MTRLFLARHGETTDQETKKVYKGSLDIPLSENGVARMTKAAAFMAATPLTAVYTSSLSRSIESGRIIAAPHRLEICAEPAFDEIHFGAWEGLSFAEIAERYPEEQRLWLQEPDIYPPPGGEDFHAARKRSMVRLKEILRERGDGDIALVLHGGILRIMIFSLLGWPLKRLFRIGQDNGCITIVDIYDDGNCVLNLLNFTQY